MNETTVGVIISDECLPPLLAGPSLAGSGILYCAICSLSCGCAWAYKRASLRGPYASRGVQTGRSCPDTYRQPLCSLTYSLMPGAAAYPIHRLARRPLWPMPLPCAFRALHSRNQTSGRGGRYRITTSSLGQMFVSTQIPSLRKNRGATRRVARRSTQSSLRSHSRENPGKHFSDLSVNVVHACGVNNHIIGDFSLLV
jgi:hypothetical protein